MITFSDFAEVWKRENLITREMSQAAIEATEATDCMSAHCPDAWSEDFARWIAENCISRPDRDDGASIRCLLLDLAEWCIGHDSVPCQCLVLEFLLQDAGFKLTEGFAVGLILKVDLEAVLYFKSASEDERPCARRAVANRQNAKA